ncbi:MAG: 30S ribosomal protein S7 [Candidatus Heimdallarchaeota archaeon]|nr:30S ribosomal protein S7 [Candidatus Heimdallarchaeota archaeon]
MAASENMKIFGLWDCQDIEITDIGLKRYINLEERLLPHSSGRHEHKRFHKSYVHIVERFANKLMSPGKNTGKKNLTLNIVKDALQIVELKTNKNPIQIFVNAIVNCAPREETTRISYGGIVYHTAVDSAPQRRVDVSIRLLANSVGKSSFNNVRAVDEILAEQLILAGTNNPNSSAIKRKQDIERVALSAR